MINYSIVIPHKNIPDLLQRCLDSIPLREDVQIIIVDDNSDPQKVDFNHFPGLGREDVEVVFTKEGKGAGYARNIGLDKAEGKWLIFMDADDLFSNSYEEILDESIDCSADLIMYDNIRVMSDDISTLSDRNPEYHEYIGDFLSGKTDDSNLRYQFQPLWGKIIRHSFVQKNKIRFSEVGWSNDYFFSTQVGCLAKELKVSDKVLYILTQRSNSLTSNFMGTKAEFTARIGEAVKAEQFLVRHNVTPSVWISKDLAYIIHKRNGGWKQYLEWMLGQPFMSKAQLVMLDYFFERVLNRIRSC